jgi:hypothetical protein
VLQSPVTEVILAYFPSDFSQAGKVATAEKLQQFVEKSHSECTDVKGLSIGWGVENDFPVKGGEEGQIGSILTAFVGWPSIDASMEFQETEAFKESLDSVKAMKGIIKLEVFRISCRTFGKKTE